MKSIKIESVNRLILKEALLTHSFNKLTLPGILSIFSENNIEVSSANKCLLCNGVHSMVKELMGRLSSPSSFVWRPLLRPFVSAEAVGLCQDKRADELVASRTFKFRGS